MLKYLTIPVTPFQQNCSLVWDDVSLQAAVIDPGGDTDVILDAVKQLGLKLEQIWITHAHVDHAAATADLAASLGLPIHGPHPEDQFWIDNLPQAVDWLSKQGVRFAPGGIRAGAAGFDICFLHPKGNDEFPIGGEGVLIELIFAIGFYNMVGITLSSFEILAPDGINQLS